MPERKCGFVEIVAVVFIALLLTGFLVFVYVSNRSIPPLTSNSTTPFPSPTATSQNERLLIVPDHRELFTFDNSKDYNLRKYVEKVRLFIPEEWSVFAENYFLKITSTQNNSNYTLSVYSYYISDDSGKNYLEKFNSDKNKEGLIYRSLNGKEVLLYKNEILIKEDQTISVISYKESLNIINDDQIKKISQWETAKAIIHKNWIKLI